MLSLLPLLFGLLGYTQRTNGLLDWRCTHMGWSGLFPASSSPPKPAAAISYLYQALGERSSISESQPGGLTIQGNFSKAEGAGPTVCAFRQQAGTAGRPACKHSSQRPGEDHRWPIEDSLRPRSTGTLAHAFTRSSAGYSPTLPPVARWAVSALHGRRAEAAICRAIGFVTVQLLWDQASWTGEQDLHP